MKETMIRRFMLLALLLVLVFPLTSSAGEEQIYTIKKGDTLWGLSQRFIDDPYYWPNLWSDNPTITNPHLIFPGQRIRIRDGRLEIIPAYAEAQPEQPAVVEETPPPPVEEVIKIHSAGGSEGFIRTSEKPLGTLVDSVDNRILLTKGDLVFLKMMPGNSATVGDTYGLYKEGRDIKHPVTEEVVGTMMNNLGFLQVTDIKGNTVIAKIGQVFREIERGAQLYEYVPPRMELTLQSGPQELNGYVLAVRDDKLTMATNDIIFIDMGEADGVQSGNMFFISRPRHASTEIIEQAGEVELPDEVLGAAVVIEPHAKTASALIIKSIDTMDIGDQVNIAGN